MRQPTDVDIKKMQEYWKNYRRYVSEIETKANTTTQQAEQKKRIVEAIEHLFNDASENMQLIVQLNWWGNKNIDEVSSVLYMPVSKVRRMQEQLLIDTAKLLHWI